MSDRFRTTLKPTKSSFLIEYGHHILAMGSCFADRMGKRMTQHKLNMMANPLGIAYHPMAIGRLLELAASKGMPDLTFAPHLEQWVSWDLHSRYNHQDKTELLASFQADVASVQQRLASLDGLIVTFGTAYVYRYLPSEQWVNNNHRFPTQDFQGELLPSQVIVDYWSSLLQKLRTARPELQVIFTLSPVRHIRHTLPLNSVSKAILRVAIHELSSMPGNHYFPAFEMMVDDLRDYRFYGEDMLHPTPVAEDYLYENFCQQFFSDKAQKLQDQVVSVRQDLAHRPRQEGSSAHRAFLLKLQGKLEQLQAKGLDYTREMSEIRRQILHFKA